MNDQFDIVKEYQLLDYDYNMSLLYHDLKSWLVQRFGDETPNFKPNQRIVFWHQDVDFYINNSFPGLTLYNLQLILRELDISNYFCAVVTRTQHYQKYTELARQLLTCDDFSIAGITSGYEGADWHVNLVKDLCPATHSNNIERPFIVLSRRRRPHRTYFMSKLFRQGLHHLGLVGYNNIPEAELLGDTSSMSPDAINDHQSCPCNFLYPVPFKRDNNDLLIKDLHSQSILANFSNSVSSFKNFDEPVDIGNHTNATWNILPVIQQALVYVGLESVAQYPEPYMSAISFKGIAHKRPFLLFAPAGHLGYLRELGFKTFDQFWSEDYDNMHDIESRTDAILNILDTLSKKSLLELQTMLEDMAPILQHNYDHFSNEFGAQEQNKFYQGLQR